jgi:hypothetical protein
MNPVYKVRPKIIHFNQADFRKSSFSAAPGGNEKVFTTKLAQFSLSSQKCSRFNQVFSWNNSALNRPCDVRTRPWFVWYCFCVHLRSVFLVLFLPFSCCQRCYSLACGVLFYYSLLLSAYLVLVLVSFLVVLFHYSLISCRCNLLWSPAFQLYNFQYYDNCFHFVVRTFLTLLLSN